MQKLPEASSITCCLDCAERHIGCHGSCERYNEQRRAHEAELAQLRVQRAHEWDYRSYKRSATARFARERLKEQRRRKK